MSFRGEHYQLDTLVSNPGSVQRPHPPILIGGTSNPALRRVARLGDGWLSTSVGPDGVGERLQVLRSLYEAQGRRFEDLSLCHKFFINVGEAEYRGDGSRVPGTGTPTDIRDDIQRFVDVGYDRFIVRYRGGDTETQRAQCEVPVCDVSQNGQVSDIRSHQVARSPAVAARCQWVQSSAGAWVYRDFGTYDLLAGCHFGACCWLRDDTRATT